MKKSKAQECVEAFRTTGSQTDVQGSYTGTAKSEAKTPDVRRNPQNLREDLRPVQDADDL